MSLHINILFYKNLPALNLTHPYFRISIMSLTSCRRLLSALPTRLSTPSFSVKPSKCVTPSLQRAYQSTSSSRTKLVASTDLNETDDILETVSRNIDYPDADKFAVISVKSRQFKVKCVAIQLIFKA